MPKHVGVGLAMKTMVRGKEIITLLNHHGHCINYWECEKIDTKWAEMSLNQFEEGKVDIIKQFFLRTLRVVHLCKVLQTMQTTCRVALMGTKVYT